LVVVIGAGLAGLSAALTLQSAGKEVQVLEGSDRPGGRLSTDYIDGFQFDRGFQLVNLNYPEFKRLDIAKDIDFIRAPRVIDVCAGDGQVSLGDPRENFLSIFNGATGSLLEKAALIRYLASTPKASEDVASHFNRVGAGAIYRKVLKPFLQGVFLSDPNRVCAVTGKEIFNSFIMGNSGVPAAGVGKVSEVLANRVKNIEYNVQVETLEEFKGQEVIVATDATHAAQLLDLPSTPEQLGCITWYHCTKEAPSENSRLRVDSENRGSVINSIVISNLASSYAPTDSHLVSSTTLAPVSESEVRRHLAIIWGVPTTQWELVAKYDIPAALPLFPVSHSPTSKSQISKGIYVAGDYRSSPSQNGALLSGRKAAQELI
jgi:hypothetical protein